MAKCRCIKRQTEQRPNRVASLIFGGNRFRGRLIDLGEGQLEFRKSTGSPIVIEPKDVTTNYPGTVIIGPRVRCPAWAQAMIIYSVVEVSDAG